MSRRALALLAAVAAAGAILPSPAHHDEPGLHPGWASSLCASRAEPDPDCVTIAYPVVDVWALSAVVPIRDDDAARAAYDGLIPAPFTPPPSGRREVGVLLFRLDLPADPAATIATDPGPGYAEGSVALRVGFPARDGFPYREGWWDLAQPLNDQSQYGAGRGIGLPKYMAEASLARTPDGGWTGVARDWGKTSATAPGSARVPGGNVLTIDWTASDPGVGQARAHEVWTWGQYGEPLFVQTAPYDEPGAHEPAMVKFTPTSFLPVYGVERSPATEYPDPIVGTATVRLEGVIPGAGSAIAAGSFADLLDPGAHVVAGTVGFVKGYAWLTSDGLANNL